jgi:hypothetical protein
MTALLIWKIIQLGATDYLQSEAGLSGDVNRDGMVDIGDLSLLVQD